MKIEIKNRWDDSVLFSHNCETLREAVVEALKNKADLRYANLRYADLSYADLRYADLRYADLRYANLSSANLRYADLRYADLRYADLRYAEDGSVCRVDFGGWSICIRSQKTSIGCQEHENKSWLKWTPESPEIITMHDNAEEWWGIHGEAIKAAIRCVMSKAKKDSRRK